MAGMKRIEAGAHPINWNKVPEFEKMVWDKLIQQFWVDTKLPLSNDLTSWKTMTDEEKDVIKKVFASLTVLDTIQSEIGAGVMKDAAETQYEAAIFSNIEFMEALAGGTQLMTPRGWKNVEDVTYDDDIAQWDDGKVEFAHPLAISNHYSDEVYQISTDSGLGKQVVSGGHRVYFEERDESGDWVGKVVEARDLVGVDLKSDNVRFLSTADRFGDKETHLTAVDRLRIAIRTCETEQEDSTHFCFDLSDESKIGRLLNLAREAGWVMEEFEQEDTRSRRFVLMVPPEYLGSKGNHFNAWWDLKDKDSTWCRDFIEEFGKWGRPSEDATNGFHYRATDESDLGFYVAVATLAGYRSLTDVDDPNSVYVDSDNGSYAGSMSIMPVESRQVYCIQVPSTFLVTRNGRGTVVTGNCIHAKFYSSVFSTLLPSDEINELFEWSESNEFLRYKGDKILDFYHAAGNSADAALRAKIASVVLESFLFYSGFYAPLYFSTRSKLTNTSDGIKLILRDEGIHGSYIGARYQSNLEDWGFSEEEKEKMHAFFLELVLDLYENEVKWTHSIYDVIGRSDDVIRLLRYNANRAAENLGYEPVFTDDYQPSPEILAALNIDSTNFDFFSGVGDSYAVIETEAVDEDEWGDMFD